jgi:acyl-CoA hydrolase
MVDVPDPKPVSASATWVVKRMRPADANVAGNVHGGVVLQLCDEAAATCAMRHARRRVVTVRISEVTFPAPVGVGELLRLKTSVNAVFGSSMEIGVRVESEVLETGEITHTTSAYFIMVAIGENGRPERVSQLVLDTPDAERRQHEAQARRDRDRDRAKS